MRNGAGHLTVACLLALWFAHAALAQKLDRAGDFSGTWQVTVRMRGKTVAEQWTIQQDGDKITGKIKSADGELSVTGEVNLLVFRATFQVGDVSRKVIATLHDDEMDGSLVVQDKDKQQYLWSAKRSGS